MKVSIKNSLLSETIDIFFNLKLKGKQSRHRSRFLKMLSDQLEKIGEEEQQLIKDYVELDENDEPIVVENDGKKTYKFIDKEKLIEEQHILLNEDFIIDGDNNKQTLLIIRDILDNTDEE